MKERIRAIIREHANLPVSTDTLSDESDLYIAGMTSLASVHVMLALEDTFAFTFPDHLLQRSVFSSINSLYATIEAIKQATGNDAALEKTD